MRLSRTLLSAFGAALLLAPAAPALAQNVTADHDQIAEVMKGAGYRAELKGEGAERYINSGAGGHSFSLLFYGCDNAGDNCKSVQLYAGFTAEKKPSLEAMNEYAAKNRWGRIYLDDDGDPCIEMDIDLEDGGMSKELFLDNLEYWEVIMNAFAAFAFSK